MKLSNFFSYEDCFADLRYPVDPVIMSNSLSINLLEVPDAQRAFINFFFPRDLKWVPQEEGYLLQRIPIPGFLHVEGTSDFEADDEDNIMETLLILDALDSPGPLEVEKERLTAFFVGIFKACVENSTLFLIPGDNEVWSKKTRIDLFYIRVFDHLMRQGIQGGGFSLKTGNQEADSQNPTDLTKFDFSILEVIIRVITLTRIANVEKFRATGETGPNTELTQVVDEWIRQTSIIGATTAEYSEDPFLQEPL
ncbi:hypothetical protein F4805DRAFT_139895 [Annulohypoxylon moriforme]|nr:hypothetical protein F4805DRAFT_139895 [Annulohypoxylon moriforme]